MTQPLFLVTLDCASGFMARHGTFYRGRKPTHVAKLPDQPVNAEWCMENFRVNPDKAHAFGRRLPLLMDV